MIIDVDCSFRERPTVDSVSNTQGRCDAIESSTLPRAGERVLLCGLATPTKNRLSSRKEALVCLALLALAPLPPSFVCAGTVVPSWVQRYHGPTEQAASPIALAVDQGGTVFVVGTDPNLDFGFDCVTVAYSSAGTPPWTNLANPSGMVQVSDLAFTNSATRFYRGARAR